MSFMFTVFKLMSEIKIAAWMQLQHLLKWVQNVQQCYTSWWSTFTKNVHEICLPTYIGNVLYDRNTSDKSTEMHL